MVRSRRFQSTPLANERRKTVQQEIRLPQRKFQSTPLANERRKRKDGYCRRGRSRFNPLLSRTRGESFSNVGVFDQRRVSIHSSREREEKEKPPRCYPLTDKFQSTPLANERRKPQSKSAALFGLMFQSTPLANERRKRITRLLCNRIECFNPLLSRTRGESLRSTIHPDFPTSFNPLLSRTRGESTKGGQSPPKNEVSIHSSREREEKGHHSR